MNATSVKTDNKVETTVKTETTLTPRQIKAQLVKAEKDAKKQAEADKKANQLILKIGTHKVPLRSNLTSLRSFKAVVGAYFTQFQLDKKEVKIELPNGTILSYSDLSTVKNFTKILFPSMYLDKSGDEQTKTFLDNIAKVQQVLFNTAIDWDIVGTKDGKQILSLYKSASTKAVELNKTTENILAIAQ